MGKDGSSALVIEEVEEPPGFELIDGGPACWRCGGIAIGRDSGNSDVERMFCPSCKESWIEYRNGCRDPENEGWD